MKMRIEQLWNATEWPLSFRVTLDLVPLHLSFSLLRCSFFSLVRVLPLVFRATSTHSIPLVVNEASASYMGWKAISHSFSLSLPSSPTICFLKRTFVCRYRLSSLSKESQGLS